MFKVVFFVVLLAVCASAQDFPHITENFESIAVVSAWNRTDRWQLVEKIAHDLSAKMQRVDTWINGTQDEFLARYDMTPPTEYVIVGSKEGKWCGSTQLEDQMEPWWNWLQYAKKTGPCNVNFNAGQGWRAEFHDKQKKADVELDLCYGNTAPLDMFIHYRHESESSYEHITFETFTDGAPPASKFDVPSECKTNAPERKQLKRAWSQVRSLHLWK